MERAKYLYDYVRENTDIFKEEEFVKENSNLTAEGTLFLIMQEINTSIYDKTYAILGDGYLGKALCELFDKLGLNYTVYARKLKNLDKIATDKNIYINTIPALVFGREVIEKLTAVDFCIDLASAPGGMDFNMLDKKSIKYNHALALPGKYCPKTAGELIGKLLTKRD